MEEVAGGLTPIKISSKFQLVLPKGLREKLDLQPGDELVGTVDGQTIKLFRRPASYARHLYGRWAREGGA
jgi:AbrB family looped-hinge helix DNA binding protein